MQDDDQKKALREHFKAKLVERANSLAPYIREGGLAFVANEIDKHSLAYGIWQDEEKDDHVGCLILKGAGVLKVCASMFPSFKLDMTCTAIPCVNAEQAYGLRELYGDGRPLDPPK